MGRLYAFRIVVLPAILVFAVGCADSARKGMAAITSPLKKVAEPVGRVTKNVAGGVKDAVATPFKEAERADASQTPRSLKARNSTDEYATEPAGSGSGAYDAPEVAQADWRRVPETREAKGGETTAAPEFDSAFERELTELRELEKRSFERAQQYDAEAREKQEIAEDFRQKHQQTMERIDRLQKIMDMYESGSIPGSRYDSMTFGQRQEPAEAYRAGDGSAAGVSTCQGPQQGWVAGETGGEAREGMRQPAKDSAAYQPPIEPVVRGSGGMKPVLGGGDDQVHSLAGPPGETNEFGGSLGAKSGTMAEPSVSAESGAQTIQATVLATDGKGPDATVIIGVGTRNGVKKGMLFELADAQGRRVVLMVKEAYLTYSRAYPHPGYAQGEVRVSDRVTQITSLPDPTPVR